MDIIPIVGILSALIGFPAVLTAGILGAKYIKYKQHRLVVRNRELDIRERELDLLEDQRYEDQKRLGNSFKELDKYSD